MLADQAAAQERVDTVSLRFNWPVGMTARVEQEIFRKDSSFSKTDSSISAYSQRLRVLEHPKGFLIRHDSMVMPGLDLAAQDTSTYAQQVLRNVVNLTPSYVVNGEGEFVELTEVERLQAAMDTLFAPMLDTIGRKSAELRAMLEKMISEEVLTSTAAESWNTMVGTWAGADWEVGAVYELDSEEQSPIIPGLMVPFHYEFGVVERVPCREGGKEDECVELIMVSTPDMAATREFVMKLVEQLAGDKDLSELATALETMEVENVITLITQPETLIPYYVSTEKHARMTIPPGASEPAGHSYRYERRALRFHYDS